MVMEIENVRRRRLIEEGHYNFIVEGKPEKFATKKTHYRKWKFNYFKDGVWQSETFILFPWESAELYLAVGGYIDDKGFAHFDPDKVSGKEIEADVVHEKDWQGTPRAKLKNIKAVEEGTKKEEPEEEDNIPF